MRTPAEVQRHKQRLDTVERLINQNWRRCDIAKRMGLTRGRISQLVHELKVAGKVDWRPADRVAAYAEFVRVLRSVEAERRLRAGLSRTPV